MRTLFVVVLVIFAISAPIVSAQSNESLIDEFGGVDSRDKPTCGKGKLPPCPPPPPSPPVTPVPPPPPGTCNIGYQYTTNMEPCITDSDCFAWATSTGLPSPEEYICFNTPLVGDQSCYVRCDGPPNGNGKLKCQRGDWGDALHCYDRTDHPAMCECDDSVVNCASHEIVAIWPDDIPIPPVTC